MSLKVRSDPPIRQNGDQSRNALPIGMTGRENLSGDRRAATISPALSPEAKPEDQRTREERCKRTPPASNKGSGGSRPFVPWPKKC